MTSEQQVEAALKSYEDVDSWKTIIFLYNAALKEVGTKLEILNDEFQHVHQYNPIEHIKTRIKTMMMQTVNKLLISYCIIYGKMLSEFHILVLVFLLMILNLLANYIQSLRIKRIF